MKRTGALLVVCASVAGNGVFAACLAILTEMAAIYPAVSRGFEFPLSKKVSTNPATNPPMWAI